jgi:hypothetical protein
VQAVVKVTKNKGKMKATVATAPPLPLAAPPEVSAQQSTVTGNSNKAPITTSLVTPSANKNFTLSSNATNKVSASKTQFVTPDPKPASARVDAAFTASTSAPPSFTAPQVVNSLPAPVAAKSIAAAPTSDNTSDKVASAKSTTKPGLNATISNRPTHTDVAAARTDFTRASGANALAGLFDVATSRISNSAKPVALTPLDPAVADAAVADLNLLISAFSRRIDNDAAYEIDAREKQGLWKLDDSDAEELALELAWEAVAISVD